MLDLTGAVQVSRPVRSVSSFPPVGTPPQLGTQRNAKRMATRVPRPGREVTSMLEAAWRMSRRP